MQTQVDSPTTSTVENAQQLLVEIGSIGTALRAKRAEATQLDADIEAATSDLQAAEASAALTPGEAAPKTERAALRSLREKKERVDLAIAGLSEQRKMLVVDVRSLAPQLQISIRDRGLERLKAIQDTMDPAIAIIRHGLSQARGVSQACDITSAHFAINGTEIISVRDRKPVLSSRQLDNEVTKEEWASFNELRDLLRSVSSVGDDSGD